MPPSPINRSRAGSRTPRYRPGYGRVSDSKIMWLETLTTKMLSVTALRPTEFDEENNIAMTSEEGLSYLLRIVVPGRKVPLTWDFSGMTIEELQATRQFFNILFDLAEPVVLERDRIAQDAQAKGDDSYSRLYRKLPQFIIREGAKPPNSESVHDGPEGPPEGSGA